MPTQNIHVLAEVFKNLEEASNAFAILQKQFRYFQEHIDVENIIAKSLTSEVIKAGTITADEIAADAITADKIDVNQLSAISANLGTITAGLMQAVTIIGAYITTSMTYPNVELNSVFNQLAAFFDANNWIKMLANSSGTPLIQLSAASGGLTANIGLDTVNNRLRILCNRGIDITPFSDAVHFPSWTQVVSDGAGQSLQTALNNKANSFSGFSGTVYVAATSGGSPTIPKTFVNGVCTS